LTPSMPFGMSEAHMKAKVLLLLALILVTGCEVGPDYHAPAPSLPPLPGGGPQCGPGFASDVIASVIYKQYQAGFYGLSTAGNVVLFLVVAAIVVPLNIFLNRKGAAE